MMLKIWISYHPRAFWSTVTKYLPHFVSQLSDIYFISNSNTLTSIFSSQAHKHFTSGLPRAFHFACMMWTLTAKKWCPFLLFFVVTDHIRRIKRANDTNQIMNLYKWNTHTHAEQYYNIYQGRTIPYVTFNVWCCFRACLLVF